MKLVIDTSVLVSRRSYCLPPSGCTSVGSRPSEGEEPQRVA